MRENLRNEFDMCELNSASWAMFVAYASVDELYADKPWLESKYEELVRHGDDKVKSAMEYWAMDREVKAVFLSQNPGLTNGDFESLRTLRHFIL